MPGRAKETETIMGYSEAVKDLGTHRVSGSAALKTAGQESDPVAFRKAFFEKFSEQSRPGAFEEKTGFGGFEIFAGGAHDSDLPSVSNIRIADLSGELAVFNGIGASDGTDDHDLDASVAPDELDELDELSELSLDDGDTDLFTNDETTFISESSLYNDADDSSDLETSGALDGLEDDLF